MGAQPLQAQRNSRHAIKHPEQHNVQTRPFAITQQRQSTPQQHPPTPASNFAGTPSSPVNLVTLRQRQRIQHTQKPAARHTGPIFTTRSNSPIQRTHQQIPACGPTSRPYLHQPDGRNPIHPALIDRQNLSPAVDLAYTN